MTSDNDSIFNRLQLFGHQRRSSSSDEDHADSDHSEDPDRLSSIRQRVDPSTSSVKRCLFGRGNSEENIKFAKKEMEKSLAESKKRWNFDFEKERPMEGRFEWQSSPYPKVLLKSRGATGEQENVEPTATTAKNTHSSIKLHTSTTSSSTTSSSSDERHCDWDPDETSSSASAPSKPELPGASSSQRSSSRQPKIDKIFRQKRSKSKVKTQERKTDQPRLEPVGVAAVATGGGAAGPPPASLDTTKPTTTQQESD